MNWVSLSLTELEICTGQLFSLQCRLQVNILVVVNYFLVSFTQDIPTCISDSVDSLTVMGFNNMSTLVGHLCRLPEKGRKEIEEIVEKMKERDSEERGTGIKGKKWKK